MTGTGALGVVVVALALAPEVEAAEGARDGTDGQGLRDAHVVGGCAWGVRGTSLTRRRARIYGSNKITSGWIDPLRLQYCR